jgi:ribosomal protein L17
MRHRVSGKRLGRSSSHRQAMERNFICSVIKHERVVTTVQKAKFLQPSVEKILTLVSRDEARHTAYGVKYLTHVAGELDARELRELEDFAFESARLLVDSRTGSTMRTSALQIWADAGLDPKTVFGELAKERDKLQRGEGGAAGPIRGFVIPTLRSIGLFSERLEGHFREMFVANFGEERASQLNLQAKLPDDLDAWVEQRI